MITKLKELLKKIALVGTDIAAITLELIDIIPMPKKWHDVIEGLAVKLKGVCE